MSVMTKASFGYGYIFPKTEKINIEYLEDRASKVCSSLDFNPFDCFKSVVVWNDKNPEIQFFIGIPIAETQDYTLVNEETVFNIEELDRKLRALMEAFDIEVVGTPRFCLSECMN